MKKAIALLLPLLLVNSIFAITITTTDPTVYPLKSSTPFTLTVIAYNNEPQKKTNVSIGIEVESPFKTVQGELYEKQVGNIDTEEESKRYFRLFTEANVPEGNYPLKLYYCLDSCTVKKYADISMYFNASSNVQIKSMTMKNELIPGEEAKITLTLKNYGQAIAKETSINLTDNGNVIFEGTNNQYIGDVAINEEKQIEFKIRLNKDITPGIYDIPIKIKHDNMIKAAGDITYEVISKAELRIVATETDPLILTENTKFTMLVTVENTGRGSARSTLLEITDNVKGNRYGYVGTLEKDEDDIAIIEIVPNGQTTYTLKLSYIDDLGAHEITKAVTFTFNPAPPKDYTTAIIISAVGFLTISYILIKKVMKNRKKD